MRSFPGLKSETWGTRHPATLPLARLCDVLKSRVMNLMIFRMRLPCKRICTVPLCCLFCIGVLALRSMAAETSGTSSPAQIDQAVEAALSDSGVRNPKIISRLDLTEPFKTSSQWTLEVAEEDVPPPSKAPMMEDHGPIFVCFVKADTPNCSEKFYQRADNERGWLGLPMHFLANRVVYAGRGKTRPLLLISLCGAEFFDGNCEVATALYRYQKRSDTFPRVFLNVTGRNNNESTRFVERGPLRGMVIVNYPTEHAPYTYWIEAYAPGKSWQYVRILHYRGRTGYGDGNPLAVIDSEMPEILRHMGLWRTGNALPVPSRLPKGCNHLSMRRGEEWCN